MIVTRLLSRLSTPKSLKPDTYYQGLLPVIVREGTVAHNLFQICLQNEDVNMPGTSAPGPEESFPKNLRQSISKLKSQNPGWEYHLIDNEKASSFILDNYGQEVLSYYDRIDARYGAARADFLRYLLLYCLGGVYIDLKCGLSRSLDESIVNPNKFHVFFWDCFEGGNHHFAISREIPEGEMLQGFIVSPAGHPFLRAVILQTMKNIDSYNPYVHGVGFGGVMGLAGPAMYTSVIYDRCKSLPGECCFSRPFADFGFMVNSLDGGEYAPGEYQQRTKMSDYRKQSLPIVDNCNNLLNFTNILYLKILSETRKVFKSLSQ